MSPRTEKQFEEIREERRAQIKTVALEIISEEGYQNTSISKIAERAGISKGLMYNYYESKEEMIREIVNDGLEKFISIFDPNKDGTLTDDEARFFIEEMFNILQANFKYWRLYFTVMLQPKVLQLMGNNLLEFMEPFFTTLVGFFTRKGYEDPMTEVRLVLALIDGVCFHYILDPENFPIEKIKQLLIKRLI
jgi:AcrR family transcriptional regulator